MPLITRIVLIFIFALLTVGIAWQMQSFSEKELLWGYLPLWLFISLLGLKTVLFIPKHSKAKYEHWRWIGLSFLGGMLLAAGFSPYPFSLLLFVGFLPFLIVEEEIRAKAGYGSSWLLFRYLWPGLLLWNILTTFWVANSALAAGIFAVSVNSLLMFIPFLLYQKASGLLKKELSPYTLIVFWIAFEYFHMRWELSWPWLTLGNGFAALPSWVQWYEYTGTQGGTLWVLVANSILFSFLKNRRENKDNSFLNNLPFRFILVILVPLIISLFLYYSWQEKGVQKVVAIVQPNFEPHYEKMSLPAKLQLERYLELSEEIVDEETDYLLYPETILGLIENKDLGKDRYTRDLKAFVDRFPKLKLVSGFSTYDRLSPPEEGKRPQTVRMDIVNNGMDTIFWQAYNTAAQFTSGKDEVPTYFKSKLVPGAEHFPFYDMLFMFSFIVDQLQGTVEGNATQQKREAFKAADGLSIGPIICYESIYGEFVSGYVREGANALFILTNDGWWDNTPGHKQHLQFACLRAIETRRSIARSANSGISAFINQRGDIISPTAYAKVAVLKESIQFNDDITFYVKWGDLIGRISIFISLFFGFISLRQYLTQQIQTTN